ncbi:1-phosphatidylinositol 3-phosphate 5-kinase isoform X2 [Ischnura elegans]|uniref:1-phosphatidylinositol 3-phosphate 5-kinase isoform X2 n=1 Tax=Ischnura elegans TaxID=197161 RepID=UPI001ED88941|nr:1-phosphatidylinositol 3-phosphate 5-kinase isoform X2 [Ischnura elegans]
MSNLQSPTKLTEFAPLSPEGRQPGVGFLLSRFFKIKRGSSQESFSSSNGSSQVPNPEEANAAGSDALPKRDATLPCNWEDNKNKPGGRSSSRLSSISSTTTSTMSVDGRSLPNVLKRISNLLAMKPTNLQAYEDTEFKQYWMPDSVSKECYECGEKFTTFRRRHHCRVCGQIFCSRCCSQEIPGKIMGCTGDLRVCTYCCKVVLAYLQSSDAGADLSADLRAVQEDLQTKLGLGEGTNLTNVLELPTPGAGPSEGIRGNNNFTNASAPPSLGGSHTGSHHHTHHHHHLGTGGSRRKTSVGYQEERYPGVRNADDNISRGLVSHVNGKSKTHSAGLRHVFDEMWRSINLGCHRYHLRTFQSCTAGSDIVDWLISHGVVSSRVQAVATAQSFMEAGLLECISHPEERTFLDEYALYRPRNSASLLAPTTLSTSSPSSSSSSSSSSSNQPVGDIPHLCPSSSSSSVPSSSPSGSELSPGQVCSGEGQEPNWVKQLEQKGDYYSEDSSNPIADEDQYRLPSSTSFYLDLNLQENKVTLSRPKREEIEEKNGKEVAVNKKRVSHNSGDPSLYNGQHIFCHGEAPNFLCVPQDQLSSDTVTSSPPHSWHLVDAKHLNPDNGEREAFLRLSSAYKSHQEALLRQLLVSEGLAQSWGDVVLPLVSQIVELVRPDVRSDTYEMDIRQYVQFKKVPGGNRSECGIISGVVCTKNIAHRAMAARLTNPRILLLGCSVAYQRVEGRFLSLEPLMMQEHDYLKNAVARIASLQPDLLLVEKNVSRLAQDFLLDLGVTLVTNMKVSVLDRVAHCTRADIVGSVDAHVGRPRLGACRAFYLKTYDLSPSGSEKQFYGLNSQSSATKTLMFFDGCPAHLGCTVILRGATKPELARLKRVVSRMVYIHYSWHLEKSFLMDEFAMPPAPLPPDSELFGDSLCSTDGAPTQDQNLECNGEENDNREVLQSEKKSTPSPSIRMAGKEKAAEDRKTVAAETVSDFSDPLHSYLSVGSATSPDVLNSEKGGDAEKNPQQSEVEDLIDEVFSSNRLSVASNPRESNRFRKALDDIVLSASPYLRHSVPYLDTEVGRNCPLRKYFPAELYWSAQFENNQMCSLGEEPVASSAVESQVEKVMPFTRCKNNHPFLRAKLTGSINSEAVQTMLANFRACGGHVPPFGGESDEECAEAEKKQPEREKGGNTYKYGLLDGPRGSIGETHDSAGHWPIKLDALDPFNHQCLPVLLCSYSHSSNNAPYFCVNPWVCHMEFYGHYDIPLGKFLERYCFSSTYSCPSDTCDVPMLSHIRRFVHGGGCVHLALKELDRTIPYVYGNSPAGQENPELRGPNPILSWSWCPDCKMASPVVPLTSESWSMSFAKYLELRFHGYVYTRRGPNGCKHSLHQEHYQYFCKEKMVASFKYTKISPWEISLPQPQILPRHSLPQWNGTAGNINGEGGAAVEEKIRHQTGLVVEEIKTLALKGYEVFATVREKLVALTPEAENALARAINSKCGSMMAQLQKDQTYFKSKIEQIQLKLTSPTLESKKLEASQGVAVAKEVMDLLLKIEDCVVQVKRLIAEAVSEWNSRLSDLAVLKKKEEKARRSIESVGNLDKTPFPQVPSSDSLVQNKSAEEVTVQSVQENDCSTLVEGVEADESIKTDENVEIPERCSLDSAMNEDFNSSFLTSSSPTSSNNKESKDDIASVPSSSSLDPSSPSFLRPQKKNNACPSEGGEISVSCSEGDASEEGKSQSYGDKVELRVPSPSGLSFTSPTAEGLEAGLGICQAWADENEFVLIHHKEVPGPESDFESSIKDSDNILNESKSDVSTVPGSVLGHGRSKSEGDGRCRSSIPPLSAPPSPAPPTHSMSADEQTVSSAGSIITAVNISCNEKRNSSQSGTVKNILSQLLPSNSNFTPIQCPLDAGEHHLLPMCATGIPVVVYESEPSSVIAYALSYSEYQRCIQEITSVGPRRFPWQNMNNTASSTQSHSDCEDGVCTTPTAKSSSSGSGRNVVNSGGSSNSTGTHNSGPSQSSRPSNEAGGNNAGTSEPDAGLDSSSNQESEGISTSTPVPQQLQQQAHIEVQFNDPSAHFYCRVYFAEQFLALRQHVLPDGEEGYVRSLSRCVKWTARGGKSGSSFYKTKDDRFVLKNMSRLEVQIFLSFAPGYFEHMRRAYEHSSVSQNAENPKNFSTPPPTLLGKIIGVYRVAFRNTGSTGSILRANFLVMENLFYGRGSRVTQRFDLKGSMRNRLVDAAASSGGSGSLHPGANGGIPNVADSEIVLLDENLLKMTCESPLYIQSHSKAVLTRAISNDTLFLASQSVMDYSLLVGLDEEKKELIVGIIDYIRTFTWDKRLENMVKSAGGKTPTIIEPDLYRGRFITAMHKYFLPVPDQWTGLGIGIDC